MGNYHPILTQISTQTKKSLLSSKFIIPEVQAKFQDGRRRRVGNLSACYKMGNCHRTLMKVRTQTKTDMLSSNVINAEAYGKKQQKLNVKSGIVLKRQRCIEREVIKSKNFSFSGRSFHTHTTCGKGIVV
jgi:hypothetical protein